MAESYGKDTHLLAEKGNEGSIYISNNVVEAIAVLASKEVEGVGGAPGRYKKNVRANFDEEGVSIDIAVTIKYNYNIPDVCALVQDRVKATVESMTELNVLDVNVKISGVEVAQ